MRSAKCLHSLVLQPLERVDHYAKQKYLQISSISLFHIVEALESYIQWCPDISPEPVQHVNGTIRGVGHKTVLLPLRRIWLKYVHYFALLKANRQCHYIELPVR